MQTVNDNIKIIGRMNKRADLYFCLYNPLLDRAIKNFQSVKTVKVLKGYCYIRSISLGYFTELLQRDNVPFSVITTLN